MTLLREPLLAAAGSSRLRRIAQDSPLVRPVVARFVAGTDEQDALRVMSELLAGGLSVTLDHLGEDVADRAQAESNVVAYRSVLAALARSRVGPAAEVSVKLSAIGRSLPRDGRQIALDGASRICEAAAAANTTVTIDMEDHAATDATLETVRELRADFDWVGVVVQAYLRRTEADCRDLASGGSRVRLCKGAYAEPSSIAFHGAAVADSYRRCLDVLLAGTGYPMIATHDPAMIAAARALVEQHRRSADSFEFQMLYGIRTGEQRAIAQAGNRMRVYVPYGQQWYGYFMRRLAERPANMRFFLRALTRR